MANSFDPDTRMFRRAEFWMMIGNVATIPALIGLVIYDRIKRH